MQDAPLLIRDLLRHGQRVHGDSSVITVEEGGSRKATFAEVATRAEKLAAALTRLGIEPGDRVGTFCWNNQGHLEAYLAIPCMGAVLHTLNIRLPADQLAYVINHAEDRCIIVDASLVPLLAGHQGRAQDRRDHHRGGGGGHLGPRRDTLLRAAARRRAARLRLARPRRAVRRGHVLHERDDRQPQGCRVLAPLHLAAHHGRAVGLLGRHDRAGPHPHHRAHVPRHGLGHALRRLAGRHRHDHAADVPDGAEAGRRHQRAPPDAGLRRADHLERPAGPRHADRLLHGARHHGRAAPRCRSRSSRRSRSASAPPSFRVGA